MAGGPITVVLSGDTARTLLELLPELSQAYQAGAEFPEERRTETAALDSLAQEIRDKLRAELARSQPQENTE